MKDRARWTAYLIALLALAGLARNSLRVLPWPIQLSHQREGREFEALAASLPADAGQRLGWVTDGKLPEPWEWNRHARYALTPRVIVELAAGEPPPRYVVGALAAATPVEDVCRAWKLRPLATVADEKGQVKVVLLESAP